MSGARRRRAWVVAFRGEPWQAALLRQQLEDAGIAAVVQRHEDPVTVGWATTLTGASHEVRVPHPHARAARRLARRYRRDPEAQGPGRERAGVAAEEGTEGKSPRVAAQQRRAKVIVGALWLAAMLATLIAMLL